MIEIIKMGKITKKCYETTCPDCNTIFTYHESDYIKDLPKYASIKLIECPLCKTRIETQKLKVPPHIPLPPPPRPLKPKSAIYELISDYIITAKKTFRFNPKRN